VSGLLHPGGLLLTSKDNILEAILPDLPDDEKETPAGFARVGHVGRFAE
jgi:hypothetical protein